MLKTKIFLALLFSLTMQGLGQVGIGEWRDHLSYREGISVCKAGTKVYCAAFPSVFVFDEADNSLEKLSKSDGLSDLGVKTIAYSEDHRMVIMGYDNGNIDLIVNNQIINVPDIKRSYISADKGIYQILVDGDLAYLSAGFGVVQLDLIKRELKETFSFGPLGTYLAVNEVSILSDSIWAATQEGIYVGALKDNLADFQNWIKVSALPSGNFNTVVNYQDRLFTNFFTGLGQDTLYQYMGGVWTKASPGTNYTNREIRSLHVTGENLIICYDEYLDVLNSTLSVVQSIFDYGTGTAPSPSQVIKDGSAYWVADRNQGLARVVNNYNGSAYTPSGPYFSDSWGMAYANGNIWVTSGNVSPNFKYNLQQKGISRYNSNEDQWTTYLGNANLDMVNSPHDIVVDPKNPDHLFIASFGDGVIEFKDEKVVKVHDETNSTVQTYPGWFLKGIGGVCFDNNGVLWASNSYTESKPLLAFKDTSWYSYSLNVSNSFDNVLVKNIAVDQFNNKYIIYYQSGIYVFNENGTLGDNSDDNHTLIKTGEGSGNLPTNEVHAIAFDEDGKFLIGGASGLLVINSTSDIFNPGGAEAERIIIDQEDGAAYLLGEEVINSITIDQANRKWIGTANNGIYLISADLQREISHFTAENSPLLSNYIVDIVVNEQSGEVFISTDKGLCSYMAGVNDNADYDGPVYAFPNPVPPNFTGEIGIRGLPNNSEVKITDISGNLIFETTATGGIASWDGKSISGEKAQSGVYIVFASTLDGSEKEVTKILFIN